MRIVVLGGNGAAGRPAIPQLVTAGHTVLAHARSDTSAAMFAAVGAEPLRGESQDPQLLRQWFTGADLVVDLRVAVPGGPRAAFPWAWRDYIELRDRAAGQVVSAALDRSVSAVIHDTTTMVLADGGEEWLDETSPVDARGPLRANTACEAHLAQFTAAGGLGIALRFSEFYGPDDPFSRAAVASAHKGRAVILGPAKAWHSALHTEDAAAAILATVRSVAGGTMPAGVHHVSDEEPLRRGELLAFLAALVERDTLRTPPGLIARAGVAATAARSQRVTSARFRAATGWNPRHPSRRTGWPEVFELLNPPTPV